MTEGEKRILKFVEESCEEHYLLADPETGMSLIYGDGIVSGIEGTENAYLIRFRMETSRYEDVKRLSTILAGKMNCIERLFCKECSILYKGSPRPQRYLECAIIVEDNSQCRTS